jgi:hypothetical protein
MHWWVEQNSASVAWLDEPGVSTGGGGGADVVLVAGGGGGGGGGAVVVVGVELLVLVDELSVVVLDVVELETDAGGVAVDVLSSDALLELPELHPAAPTAAITSTIAAVRLITSADSRTRADATGGRIL